MNIVGPPLGKVSTVPENHSEWNVNQAIAIFRTIEGVEREYLAGLLMTEQILRWATQRAKATAGQFNLTLEICRDLPIPLPPADEQKRIVAELDRQISNLERTGLLVDSCSTRISSARQSILTAAFAGQLVPQDATEEPASVLLERIRAGRVKQPVHKAVRIQKKLKTVSKRGAK
jgi:type I restriction enzyme S subunit